MFMFVNKLNMLFIDYIATVLSRIHFSLTHLLFKYLCKIFTDQSILCKLIGLAINYVFIFLEVRYISIHLN